MSRGGDAATLSRMPGDDDRTFLVECYLPSFDRSKATGAADRARAACAQIREDGWGAEYLGALHVPDDELVYHVFRATQPEAVRRAGTLARLGIERIVESIPVAASQERVIPGLPGPAPDRGEASRR